MKTYTITKCSGNINWESIPALNIDTQLWGTETDITAQGKVCYDEEALHVRLSAVEANIRAEEHGPLGSPCQDSCLEFFFCPVAEDSRYFNIEFSPTGCVYLGFGHDRYDLIRLLPEKGLFHPEINRTTDGWEITYSVPYSFLRLFLPNFQAVSGGHIRANFYKCGDRTVKEHYLSWNPITCENPDYHLSQYFGDLYFE